MWAHEQLEIYPHAVAAAVALDKIARGIPSIRRDLRDQLFRASASIVLNLAEGAAEFSHEEKARFYRMSRRSAAECASILDIHAGLFRRDPAIQEVREQLAKVAATLTALIKRYSGAAQSSGRPSPSPSPSPSPDASRHV